MSSEYVDAHQNPEEYNQLKNEIQQYYLKYQNVLTDQQKHILLSFLRSDKIPKDWIYYVETGVGAEDIGINIKEKEKQERIKTYNETGWYPGEAYTDYIAPGEVPQVSEKIDENTLSSEKQHLEKQGQQLSEEGSELQQEFKDISPYIDEIMYFRVTGEGGEKVVEYKGKKYTISQLSEYYKNLELQGIHFNTKIGLFEEEVGKYNLKVEQYNRQQLEKIKTPQQQPLFQNSIAEKIIGFGKWVDEQLGEGGRIIASTIFALSNPAGILSLRGMGQKLKPFETLAEFPAGFIGSFESWGELFGMNEAPDIGGAIFRGIFSGNWSETQYLSEHPFYTAGSLFGEYVQGWMMGKAWSKIAPRVARHIPQSVKSKFTPVKEAVSRRITPILEKLGMVEKYGVVEEAAEVHGEGFGKRIGREFRGIEVGDVITKTRKIGYEEALNYLDELNKPIHGAKGIIDEELLSGKQFLKRGGYVDWETDLFNAIRSSNLSRGEYKISFPHFRSGETGIFSQYDYMRGISNLPSLLEDIDKFGVEAGEQFFIQKTKKGYKFIRILSGEQERLFLSEPELYYRYRFYPHSFYQKIGGEGIGESGKIFKSGKPGWGQQFLQFYQEYQDYFVKQFLSPKIVNISLKQELKPSVKAGITSLTKTALKTEAKQSVNVKPFTGVKTVQKIKSTPIATVNIGSKSKTILTPKPRTFKPPNINIDIKKKSRPITRVNIGENTVFPIPHPTIPKTIPRGGIRTIQPTIPGTIQPIVPRIFQPIPPINVPKKPPKIPYTPSIPSEEPGIPRKISFGLGGGGGFSIPSPRKKYWKGLRIFPLASPQQLLSIKTRRKRKKKRKKKKKGDVFEFL